MSLESQEKLNASQELVEFLNDHSKLMARHLDSINTRLGNALSQFMNNISEISDELQELRTSAETQLFEASVTPDVGTRNLLNRVQDSVDIAFKEAQDLTVSKENKNQVEDNLEGRLRRFSGNYSKNIEGVALAQETILAEFMTMIGSLSRDDIIKQKLNHIELSVQALSVALSYIIIDLNHRLLPEKEALIYGDLQQYVARIITTTEEREIFYQYFPEVRKKS